MLLLRLDEAGIHVHQFLDVTVQILIAVAVHESVILRLFEGLTTRGDGLANKVVDLGSVLTREADQHLGLLGRIADSVRRELFELRMRQQHHIDVFADDHAGGSLVRELHIERVAQALEERDRLVEIDDWQIDKDLGCHDFTFYGTKCRSLRSANVRNIAIAF